MHAGSVRSFLVRGTVGFAAQGGRSVGCGIPAGATAVVASVTANGEPYDLSIKASTAASTQVIVDVDGYYEQQIEASVNSDGTIFSSTDRIDDSTLLSTGLYLLTIDTDVSFCAVNATTIGSGTGATVAAVGSEINVRIHDAGGSPADAAFDLTVTC